MTSTEGKWDISKSASPFPRFDLIEIREDYE